MKTFSVNILGVPEAAQSFGVTVSGHKYPNPIKVKMEKMYIPQIKQAIAMTKGFSMFDKPVFAFAIFRLPPIKTMTKKKKKAISGGILVPTKSRSDEDNFKKPLYDSMQKAGLLKNDNQIASSFYAKTFSNSPGVNLVVKELEHDCFDFNAIFSFMYTFPESSKRGYSQYMFSERGFWCNTPGIDELQQQMRENGKNEHEIYDAVCDIIEKHRHSFGSTGKF